MPDAGPDLLTLKCPPVYVTVRRLQPRQVQVQTARPAPAHLHRGEMTPALVFQKGEGRLVGWVAVDLDRDVIAGHSADPFEPVTRSPRTLSSPLVHTAPSHLTTPVSAQNYSMRTMNRRSAR